MADLPVLTITLLREMDPEYLLLPVEVAGVFRVDPKTVTRWAAKKGLACIRTEGGHRRFKVGEVLSWLNEQ